MRPETQRLRGSLPRTGFLLLVRSQKPEIPFPIHWSPNDAETVSGFTFRAGLRSSGDSQASPTHAPHKLPNPERRWIPSWGRAEPVTRSLFLPEHPCSLLSLPLCSSWARVLWCSVPPFLSIPSGTPRRDLPRSLGFPPSPPPPPPHRPQYLEITQEMFEGIKQTHQHNVVFLLPCTLES